MSESPTKSQESLAVTGTYPEYAGLRKSSNDAPAKMASFSQVGRLPFPDQVFAVERGYALVAVLHDLTIALNHFERLWLVREGRLLADCDAEPSALPLLERLYGVRLRVLRDAEGLAVQASARPAVEQAA